MIYIIAIILLVVICGASVIRSFKLSRDLEDQEQYINKLIDNIIKHIYKNDKSE